MSEFLQLVKKLRMLARKKTELNKQADKIRRKYIQAVEGKDHAKSKKLFLDLNRVTKELDGICRKWNRVEIQIRELRRRVKQ